MGSPRLNGIPDKAFERVDARMGKSPQAKATRLQVTGSFFIDYAWEARGSDFAPKVTEEGFRKFHERIIDARKALSAAWEARPDDPRTAYLMMTVERAIGEGDRDAMELWFDRALRADGFNQPACWEKLDWLDPKWHGTAEEMLAFGEQCRATRNWRAGITLLACDAHLRRHAMLDAVEQQKYLASPEAWAEIKSVYDEYLEPYPGNDVVRGKYATLAFLSGKYAEAHAQFQILGDRLVEWPEPPNIDLQAMKRFRDEATLMVTGKPRDAAAPK